MLTTLAVENYRSLRSLVTRLGALTVVTGANGTGKSSLYRAMRVLADAARGGAVAALAREGGLPSTLWAGPERLSAAMREGRQAVEGTVRRERVGLRLGFAGDEFGYAVDFGLPQPSKSSMFERDPEIKAEAVWSGPQLRPARLLSERRGAGVRLRAADGTWTHETHGLRPYDSMLSELADPQRAPDLLTVRELLRSWRFYDHVRTDADAPARSGRIGTRTPVLAADGGDLAAAWRTIVEVGDAAALAEAVDLAFPGSVVEVVARDGWFELTLRQPGLLRPLGVAELSDGTLRYLLWVAALLSPRPPALLVLNEPETSLHPDLLPPLAHLVAAAARRSQVVVVSHARAFASALAAAGDDLDVHTIELVKDTGQTMIDGQGRFDGPAWTWPKR